MSIRFKVILPYLLLTLVVAITGVYVVTKLVANSLSERLTNQLLEAGRVVSDGMAREELKHVDNGRIVAFTRGLAEAVRAEDGATVTELARPVAAGLGIENLIVVDLSGRELLHLIKGEDGVLRQNTQPSGAGFSTMTQAILTSNNLDSLPQRALGLNPLDGRYYYYTAIPIPLNNQLVGAVILGTPLNTLLPYLKSTSLADVIFYAQDGRAIATTLAVQSDAPGFLKTISILPEKYQQIIAADETVSGESFNVEDRSYSLARGALRVGDDRLGVFAVVLPLNYVLQSGAVSRNTYVILFTVAMLAVVLVGYAISRLIINPLHALVHTSRAISQGDLTKRSGIRGTDEIGILANTFDEMTGNLQERTLELERTNRMLEQMDRTKVSFIEVSAHELRTPLTLVKGYTQMLEQRAKSDPQMAPFVTGILDGTERMNEIVNSMLDVSKIDSKTLKVVPDNTVQIGLLIMRVQKTFQKALEERKLTLNTQGLNSLPVLCADPDLLLKVFYHLIMNAIKYTPDGGTITISGHISQEDHKAPMLEIVVCDTGVGIAPENHELIFQKFFQTGEVLLHSSGKTKFKGGGPGLGLAIARGIVEAHQGRIWVESAGYDETKCPGSQFHVCLPVKGAGQK